MIKIIRLRNRNKRYKPLYKKFKQLFENVQSRKKIFYFGKKKWQNLIDYLEKKNFFRKKNRIFNHTGNTLRPVIEPRRAPRFKKSFKNLMHTAKKLNLFYGGLKKKYMKKSVKTIWRKKKNNTKNKILGNIKFYFLDFMERRLESVLYRSFFTQSIKSARQLILHGHIFINNRKIKHGSYILRENDLITINPTFHNFILNNIKTSKCWPTTLTHLIINYKTLQIMYIGRPNLDTFTNLFPFRINIKKVIKYYKYN